MSKFIDRLKQLSDGSPQPIGFRLGARAPARLRIQLIGLLSKQIESVKTEAFAEADAVILNPGEKPATPVKSLLEKNDNGKPVGIHFTADSATEAKTIIECGADFATFSSDFPVTTFPDKVTGKVLELDATLADSTLRVVNALPVDAVMVTNLIQNSPITYQDLLNIRKLTGSINKPFLLSVPAEVSAGELQIIWEAGVDGIVVDITTNAKDTLTELRQAIEKLEFPDTNRKERLTPTVPHMAAQPAEKEDDEEEEEEEE